MKNLKLIPPFSALIVFMASLLGCSSPVQINAQKSQINNLPSQTTNIQHNNKTIKLHYKTSQTSPQNPNYIFIHGTPGSANGWSDFLISAPENKHYIAIDRLGFGQSEPKTAVTSLKTQAASIGKILENQTQPAILIGHSLGGPIVTQAALDYPDKIAAIIIVAGALDPDLEKIVSVQYLGRIWPFSAILPRQIRNANIELIELKEELITLKTRLPELKTPTVILHGTEDNLVPYENVAFMKSHFTSVEKLEIITLENKGHFLPWDSAEELKKAIEIAEKLINA